MLTSSRIAFASSLADASVYAFTPFCPAVSIGECAVNVGLVGVQQTMTAMPAL